MEALFSRVPRGLLPEVEGRCLGEIDNNHVRTERAGQNERETIWRGLPGKEIAVVDIVLVRNQRPEGKLSLPYDTQPLGVTHVKGSMVTAANTRGTVTRKVSFFKQIRLANTEEIVTQGSGPDAEVPQRNDGPPETPGTPETPNIEARRLAKTFYQMAQSLVFTVEEINRNPELLANLTLGFSIVDSCDSVGQALRGVMRFLAGQEQAVANFGCRAQPPLAALIGDDKSHMTIPIARLLGIYGFPQKMKQADMCSVAAKDKSSTDESGDDPGETLTNVGTGRMRRRSKIHRISALDHGNTEPKKKCRRPKCFINIQGQETRMTIDTGASVNVMPTTVFRALRPQPELKSTETLLFAYGSMMPLPAEERFRTELSRGETDIKSKMYIVNAGIECLLSGDAVEDLGLIRLICAVTDSTDVTDLLAKHPGILKGIGCLKGKLIKLHIDPIVQPQAVHHRRTPFHMRDLLVKELKELEKAGIIEQVMGPTPWVSPMVVTKKQKKTGKISFAASVAVLSDKTQFPSFLRTTPSDDHQAYGLAKMVIHFGWTWVGILAEETDYGLQGSQVFYNELQQAGYCVAFFLMLPMVTSRDSTQHLVETIRASTATVIMVFATVYLLAPVMDAMAKGGVQGKVWLASDGWIINSILNKPYHRNTLKGTIGFSPKLGTIPGFRDYLYRLNPYNAAGDIFIKDFWEEMFGCQCEGPGRNKTVLDFPSQANGCTGNEELKMLKDSLFGADQLWETFNIYNAVYAIAHALNELQPCRISKGVQGSSKICSLQSWKCKTGKRSLANWHARQHLLSIMSTIGLLICQAALTIETKPSLTCLNAQHGKQCSQLKGNPPQHVSLLLLHYIKTVHFTNNMGDEMYFDTNGNPPAVFDILNWQSTPEGSFAYVTVGQFDSRAPSGLELTLNEEAIMWNSGLRQELICIAKKDFEPHYESSHNPVAARLVPHSVCSDDCPPGFRKNILKGQPQCCFTCLSCPEGEISKHSNSIDCTKCPDEEWPNGPQDWCSPKAVEFLSFQEPLGLSLVIATVLASLTPPIVFFIFVKHMDTPIVKANSRELSFLLLFALFLCFLSSFLFFGQPGLVNCMLRQVTFGISFVLCISCVLGKTCMVLLAFHIRKPKSELQTWLGPNVPKIIIAGCTTLQTVGCTIWLIASPPFPLTNTESIPGKVILECNEGSSVAFWCMMGYMGLLALVSFIVAFISRNLPDSFNEAKFITFSMLVFVSVWLSFVPAYISARGKYMVAVETFAILASTTGLMACIFIPKCYIILLKPNMNTKEFLMGRGAFRTNTN
ncbi:vomeronasal type-2 receptor 1-like [Ambystoma mexicanum]|uniref:vomeronasal type-2 receptor 1-like n=1 Tax=Ambystoma mexicanum TaxID=8296 RepID=UPI0037E921D5